ncbi:MAG: aminotransferase class III-fold pyridoxal phosphate-dependent enzyme, partial [Rhodobacteraceae bacterium]
MDGGPLTNMQARDVEALLHPYTNAVQHRQVGPHIIESGQGVYVFDDQGNRFIEGMAGLWCAGLGFGDAELIEAAREQLGKLPYYHLFAGRSFEPAIELAEKLKDLAPVPMSKVFYQSSGSEANESQVKLAWYYNNARGKTEKKKIISRVKGYHGVGVMSASLTGLPYNHRNFDLPVTDRVKHVATPHHWRGAEKGETERAFAARLAADLDAFIEAEGPDTVAAFIAEPIMGAGGVIVPPEGYFEAIMPVLKKHDVLMIDDEVICGFGRTGNWFGATTVGMEPTSISMAKQLTAAY